MKTHGHATRTAIFLISMLMSISAFAIDNDAETDNAKGKLYKAPAADQDAKSGGDAGSGAALTAEEKAAAIAKAATDPSAILTQFQNLFWTTGSSEDKNISNTYLFQPVLPLSKN